MYWIRYFLLLAACFCTFEIGAQTASCGWNDPVVRFLGGDKACFKEFPLLMKTGVISTDQNLSYSSIAERNGARYAIAISSNPQYCPFVSYTSWKQSGREATEAFNNCQEKLRKVNEGSGPSVIRPACNCEILIDGGEVPLTRSQFKEKTEIYERQLAQGGSPLEKVSSQIAVVNSAVPITAAPLNPVSQVDKVRLEQEQQRLIQDARDKEAKEQLRLRQQEQERIARIEEERKKKEQQEQIAALEAQRRKAELVAAELQNLKQEQQRLLQEVKDREAKEQLRLRQQEQERIARIEEERKKKEQQEQIAALEVQRIRAEAADANRLRVEAMERLGKRTALVIGNANYKVRPLNNPVNDSSDIARALRVSGFDVIEVSNATLSQMRSAARLFADKLLSSDVGLVYYSGHGVEVQGKNYLIPVNADIQREYEVPDQSYAASQFVDMMESIPYSKGQRVNILIIDACRNNELPKSWRAVNSGLARMEAPAGTFIAFATAPGKVASDGQGRNSPFTKHLLKAMQQPNQPIEQVFKTVRRGVMQETSGLQVPWENSSLVGDFFFTVQR